MKFGKRLDSEAVPEWRPKYLNYRALKELLRQIPVGGDADEQRLQARAQFSTLAHTEYDKICSFYWEREEAALKRHGQLQAQLEHYKATALAENANFAKPLERFVRHRLKKALILLYGEMELVKAFRSLNWIAFVKIMKKADKVLVGHAAPPDKTLAPLGSQFMAWLQGQPIWLSPTITELMTSIELAFTSAFTRGDRHRAMQQLRSKDLAHQSFYSAALVAGASWATATALIAYTLALLPRVLPFSPWRHCLLWVYAGQFLPFALVLAWSLNTLGFNRLHINYRFIFHLDRRSALHECQFAAVNGVLALVFAGSAQLCLATLRDGSRLAPLLPALSTASTAAMLAFLYQPSFRWLSRALGHICITPTLPVTFCDFFIADQLLSVSIAFQAMAWTLVLCAEPDTEFAALFSHWLAPLLASFPFFWRGAQCIRRYQDTRIITNMLNCGKYALSFAAFVLRAALALVGVGNWRLLIIPEVLVGAAGCVSYFWDLIMDFGLLQSGTRPKGLAAPGALLLRSQLVYPAPFYYATMAADLAVRMLWVLPLWFRFFRGRDQHFLLRLSFCMGACELVRRLLWNFIRIEYEHLNNCNLFRATEVVELPFRTADLFYQDMVDVRNTAAEDGTAMAMAMDPSSAAENAAEDDDFEDEEEE